MQLLFLTLLWVSRSQSLKTIQQHANEEEKNYSLFMFLQLPEEKLWSALVIFNHQHYGHLTSRILQQATPANVVLITDVEGLNHCAAACDSWIKQ